MQVTIYPINVQKNMFKYFVFWDKKQMSRSEYVYFKSINFIKFCYFYVVHNTKKNRNKI
jgi:hypothetical protein